MNTRCLLIMIGGCTLAGCESPKYSEVPPATPEPRFVVGTSTTNSPTQEFVADPKADPVVAEHDRPMILAIQRRWSKLLEERHIEGLPQGQVTLRFRNHADGTISDVVVAKSTVDAALTQLAQEALSEAAPFGAWPDEMRQKVKAKYREITFTFFYGSRTKE